MLRDRVAEANRYATVTVHRAQILYPPVQRGFAEAGRRSALLATSEPMRNRRAPSGRSRAGSDDPLAARQVRRGVQFGSAHDHGTIDVKRPPGARSEGAGGGEPGASPGGNQKDGTRADLRCTCGSRR